MGNSGLDDLTVLAPAGVPPDPEALKVLRRLARAPWVAAPPVALPDLHLKPRLETPSSVVVATSGVVVPSLTSPSLHCGMSLVVTDLEEGFATEARLDRLFAHLAARLAPRREGDALGDEGLDQVLCGGMEAWRSRVPQVEMMPTMAGRREGPLDPAALEMIPSWLRAVARREFGTVGLGNHFLEMQVVEEVIDPRRAAAWSVERGRIVFLLHADAGHLGAVLGRLLAHRRKNSWRGRLREWRAKVPYHVRDVRSLRGLVERARLFLPARWVPLREDSAVGRLCRSAASLVARYGAANRLAVWEAVAEALAAVGGPGGLRLLWDAPHNGIWREMVDGDEVWVHRHNAARVEPGMPVLLPGRERTSSLLCVGAAGAERTLRSASHGAGEAAMRLGRVGPEDGRTTRLYGYGGPPRRLPLVDDRGVWAVAEALAAAEVALPVARMQPLATLKGARGG
ncbi:MAG TPA: RtcB family protein [Thermoflexia bacterium]|jgi:RNA-splicing ligase RtcB|nr:RtcB family protein [Thermoflexia bacterium]